MKAFFDTNQIIYLYSSNELNKTNTVKNCVLETDSHVSTQVLQEMCNVMRRKYGAPLTVIDNILSQIEMNFKIYKNSVSTVRLALQIADRYQFAFYDSMIIAAALESGCSILYSEDMHHEQKIDNQLTILNPFLI